MVLQSFLQQLTIQLTCSSLSNLYLHFNVLKIFYQGLLLPHVHCFFYQKALLPLATITTQLTQCSYVFQSWLCQHCTLPDTLKNSKICAKIFMQLRIKVIIIFYWKGYTQNWKIIWKITAISYYTGGVLTAFSITEKLLNSDS